MSDTESITRRNLPHWYRPGFAHFVTYRLAGTVPKARLKQWRDARDAGLQHGPPEGRNSFAYCERLYKQFFAEYDRYLDMNRTRKWLADSRIAAIVEENLQHHDGVKYQLLAWCIMSNHVHVVLQPIELSIAGARSAFATPASEAVDLPEEYFGDEVSDALSPLSNNLHSLKSYTANQANAILERTGSFWQPESYDHWIRDLDELERVVAYVTHNPVKAGLCATPVEWRFSSAYVRHQRDGSTCGLVGRLRDDWHP